MQRFHEEWSLVATIDPIDANNADSETDEIDMSKFSELHAIVFLGVLNASATLDFALHQSATSGSGFALITGKSITQIDGADDGKQVCINLKAEEMTPSKRYVKGVMANSAHSQLACVAIFGRAIYQPATDHDLSSVEEIVT